MKEETFKEYEWRGKDLKKLLESAGVKGDIQSIYSDYGHSGLYLHVKTKTESEEK